MMSLETNPTVDVMLLCYLELRFVPVQLTACSLECQAAILQHYRELQAKTQAEIDREYEENMRLAKKQAGRSGVDISTRMIGVPEQHISHFDPTIQYNYHRPAYTTVHRQRKCIVM